MARFYGTMGNGRGGLATKCGHARNGIEAHVRGWDVGVMVSAIADPDTGGATDMFDVYVTGGSTGSAPTVKVGTVRLDADTGAPVFETADSSSWESVR